MRGELPTLENRRWVFSTCDFSAHEDRVVVCSYNILGIGNASKHLDLYSEVPPELLEWEGRKKVIHEEIKGYNPGVMCFQEVDHFDDVEDLLCKDGFKGIYKARTGEAIDGCAIFWKDELFTLLHQENIEFRDFGLRDNVAQLCVLKMNQKLVASKLNSQGTECPSNRLLLVGNIHVLFNPKRGEMKLGQIRLFLEKAHKLSQNWGGIPIILGGDMNCVPQLNVQLHNHRDISGQLEFPLHSRIFRHKNNYRAGWSSEQIKLATSNEGVTHLRHPLNLHSAYPMVPGSGRTRDKNGEPLATSYHSKFLGTVDYIWHTEELVPVRVLDTFPMDTLMKIGGLPSKACGSDHLAIVCELAFVDHMET